LDLNSSKKIDLIIIAYDLSRASIMLLLSHVWQISVNL